MTVFKWSLLAAVVAVCVGYLIYAASWSGVSYYRTVAEVKARPGPDVRVLGTAQDVKQGASPLDVTFVEVDHGYRMPVAYHGQVPDIFKNGVQVVVEGRMGADGVFHASSLITKCPSKFTAGPQGK